MHPAHGITVKKSTETAAVSSEITENVETREPVKPLKHLARICLFINSNPGGRPWPREGSK